MIPWIYLKDRKIIACKGEQAAELLQGLVTQDVFALKKSGGGFCVLLNAKGFFQADFFLFFHDDGVFLDCHQRHAEAVLMLLQRYAVLHDVCVSFSEHYAVCCALGHRALGMLQELPSAMAVHCLFIEDPRHPEMGGRFLMPYAQWQTAPHPLFIPHDAYLYHQKRMELGVPEGAFDLVVDRSVILEYGYQHLHAISWDKGCYLGQELMARTFHRGQLRKTLYRVHSPVPGCFPACGETLFWGQNKVGIMGGSQECVGLASLYQEIVPLDSQLTFENEEGILRFDAQIHCFYPLPTLN